MTLATQSAPILVRDADQARKLEAVADSGACEAGRVVALDFAAIRTAIGERWPARRDDVHDRIERELERRLPRASIAFKISDCEYLLGFNDAHGIEAQVYALRIMEEILTYFLGRFSSHDLLVKCVSSISGDAVEMRPLCHADVEQEKVRQASGASDPPASAPSPSSALVEGTLERLHVRVASQDIVHLATGMTIGTRACVNLFKRGTGELLSFREEFGLSTHSLVQASLFAIANLHGLMSEASRPTVFVLPLFLQTMSNWRGRNAILAELQRLGRFEQHRLLIEIAGIERGTPSSRLMETGWQLRPFCRAVCGRAQLERSGLQALAAARLSGIHLSARDLGLSNAQKAAALLAAGHSASNLTAITMAVDLPNVESLGICQVAGFSHATLPAGLLRRADPGAEDGCNIEAAGVFGR